MDLVQRRIALRWDSYERAKENTSLNGSSFEMLRAIELDSRLMTQVNLMRDLHSQLSRSSPSFSPTHKIWHKLSSGFKH